MPSLVGFRNTNPPSPYRFVYGVRNNLYLLPLDITFTHFSPDIPEMAGVFLGAAVSGPAGIAIGTIASYSCPLAGLVNPVVEVTPDPSFPATPFPSLPAPKLGLAPGTVVETQIHNSLVQGTIVAFAPNAPYLDPAHQVPAYIVNFNVPLTPDYHGSAVFTVQNRDLVGMVVQTKPQFGLPNTLVAPV